MSEQIMLDGQGLNGADRLGAWSTTGLEGWWDSPDPKSDDAPRAQADGDFDLPVYYNARYVTITGGLRAASHASMHEAMTRFTGLMRGAGRLVVSGHGSTQWADVKRASGFTIEPATDVYAQWQVRLKAPDPRKFGDVNTFSMPAGATVSVFHRGNYPATPRITVTGSMPGYTLTVNGWSYAVSVPLVSGTPHVIDYNDGRLRINGAVVQNSIGNTNLTTIPPGQSVAAGLFATSGGSGTATMALPDTFI